ncbi:MAG: gamma-glutamyltransferase [Acetobacteraceae bacterium]
MFTTRPELAGTFGMVATTHWIASGVGLAVLERGGNAADAAVAAAFTLHVAELHLNGPGGDAPILLHDAATARQHVICGQGPAPQAAKRATRAARSSGCRRGTHPATAQGRPIQAGRRRTGLGRART